ncbi:DUF2189 domain-containing protein [Corallincola platygyrae]|uniref:DUF2189 domain-containing protein n=1 Tax=Corallincola platygyrae TaxID=1193278 RepID=A0ABW4XN58_9GAMM
MPTAKNVYDKAFARTIPCNRLGNWEPLHWLALAVDDFKRVPLLSLTYGILFAVASALIIALVYMHGSHLVILPSLMLFVLIGPFLATGLYDVSWELEKGHKPSFVHSAKAIGRNRGSEWGFALILSLTMMVWMRVAALIHALYPSVQGAHFEEFLPFLMLGSLFGVIFSSFVFAISVFSLPLMMERRVDTMTAIFTSVNAAKNNLPAMFVWAIILFIGVFIGFATGGIGMVIVMPLLGYATWHGYIRTIQTKQQRRYE